MAISQFPQAKLLNTQTTLTANATATFTLDLAESYLFILDVGGTISGTSETLDVFLEHSPDGGTTWYAFAEFTQVTTAAKKFSVRLRPSMAMGEAGSFQDISEAAAGTAFAKNGPITQNCRVNYLVGGTSPSYGSVKLWVVENPRGEREVY